MKNFKSRESGRSIMHEAVCDECGKECQVPFKPTSGKPLYCSECFDKKGGRNSNRPGRRDSYRPSYRERDSGRFRENRGGDQTSAQLVEKIESLNSRLDKIIALLSAGKKEDQEKSKQENKQKAKTQKVKKKK